LNILREVLVEDPTRIGRLHTNHKREREKDK